jgi:zinc protease
METVQPSLFDLPNGLTLIVAEEHSAPVASVQAWCQTGSVHEGKWTGAGLTHLLEHVLFNGTERRTSQQINQEIHAVGGYLNAYTSFDRTVFWADCPGHTVGLAIDLIGDMMFRSVIEPSALAREMDVIRREFDMGLDDPDRVLNHLTYITAFQMHPCRYPVIGIREIFDQLTEKDVLEYYHRRYVPNNLFLVVAGDVSTEEVRKQAEELLGFARRSPMEPIVLPEEPVQLGRRRASLESKIDLSFFSLAWHIPDVAHEDVAALDVLATALGGGFSSRLHRELREREGLVYGIGAYSHTPSFPGLLSVSGTCAESQVDSVIARVSECIDRAYKVGFTVGEVGKAKRMITVSTLENLQTVRGLASDLGLNWLYTRNLDFSKEYLAHIQEVNPNDLERVATRYVTDTNLTVTTLQPEKKTKRPVAVRKGRKEPELHHLSNGHRAVLIPDSRLPMIYASVAVKGGSMAESRRTEGIHRLMSMAMTKGTRSRSAEEIAEETEAMGAMLFADSGYNSVRLSVSSLSADFGDICQLVTEVAAAPVFRSEPTERERESQIAAIVAEKAQPHAVAYNLLRAEIYGDHPYGLNPFGREETVRGFTLDQLTERHHRCFTESDVVIGVCGDFEPKETLARLEKMVGQLPNSSDRKDPQIPEVSAFKERTVTSLEGRNQAVVHIGFLACTIHDPDRHSLELLEEATGDASSRFFVKIREELGLAYSVGSGLFLGLAPGVFSVHAATAPERVDEVNSIIRAEIGRIGEHGISQDEFERAKTRMLAQMAFQNQNMEAYAHALALHELYGLGVDYLQKRDQQIRELTREAVNEVIRKYLADKPAIAVIVKP